MADTKLTTPREHEPGPIGYRLVLLYGPPEQHSAACDLGDQPLLLGRSLPEGTLGLALHQSEVSREHAVVEPDPAGGYALRDLGSHNGTFVNRERISRRNLVHGDVVRVGSCLLLFQALAAEPRRGLPPLRERREDILELARDFLQRAERSGAIDPDAAEALLVHDWPFDVRELEETVSQAGRSGDAPGIRFTDLPPRLRIPSAAPAHSPAPTAAPSELPPTLPQLAPDSSPSKEDLEALMEHFNGNIDRVAAFFNKERRDVYRWAERHGIELSRTR